MIPEKNPPGFWKPFAFLALLAAGELCAAPTITTHPTTPLMGLGMPSLTLNVAATGNGTLSYQWLRNGAVIPGASQASLTLAPVDHTTRGVYQVRVTDDDGTTLSRMTRVGYAAGKLLLWDGFGDLDITYGAVRGLAKGSGPVGYQVYANGTVGGTMVSPNVFPGTKVQRWAVTMVGPGSGAYWWKPSNLEPVVALASAGNKAFAVETDGDVIGWSGTSGGDWPAIGTVSMYHTPPGLGPCLDVSMNAQEVVAVKADGTLAQWAVTTDSMPPPAGTPPAGVANVIAVSSSPTHHLALIRDGSVAAWGTNANGECDVPPGLSGVVEIAAGHGFSLVLKQDGTVAAWGDNATGQTTIPSSLNSVLSIYAGTHCMATRADGSVVKWGTLAPQVPSFVTSGVSPGQVTSAWSSSYPAVVEPYRMPSIARSPDSVSTRPGYSITLEAEASGFPAPTIRWQKNEIDVPGATSKKLVLRNITAAEVGSYRAVFTSLVGEVPTTAAVVTLLDEPVITSQPVDQNVLLGTAARFVVSVTPPAANSTLPLSFQWLKNGFIIPGATQAVLNIPAVRTADIGEYQAVINGTVIEGGTLKLVPNAQRSKVARLRIKGEPVSWGRQGYSSEWLKNYGTQIPSGVQVTDTVEVAAAGLSFLIRDASGVMKQWNIVGESPEYGTPPAPVATIASGNGRFISIAADGLVREWFADVSRINPGYFAPSGSARVVQPRNYYRDNTEEPILPWFHAQGAPAVKIACGAYHNLALLEDGGVSAWVSQIATAKPDYFGSASSGRTHQQSSLPTGFMAGRTAAAVAAGAYHNLVLFSDGTVGAWGKNDAGQATVPAGLSNVVRIIAFGDTSIAIKADGQIVSWGRVSNTVPTLDRPALTPMTPMNPFRHRSTRFSISSTGTPSGTQISLNSPGAAQLGYTSAISTTTGATLSLSSGVSTLTGLIKVGNVTLNTGLLTLNPVNTIQGGVLTVSPTSTTTNSSTNTGSLAGLITSGSTLTLGSSGPISTGTSTLGSVQLSSGVLPTLQTVSTGTVVTVNSSTITTGSTLNLSSTASPLLLSTANLTVNSGSTITGTSLLSSSSLTLATPSSLTINSGNVTLSDATLATGAHPTITIGAGATVTIGAGATVTIGSVTHTGPLTLQRQTDGTYAPAAASIVVNSSTTSATIQITNPSVSSVSSVATTTTTSGTSNLTLSSTSGLNLIDFTTIPTFDLGSISWDTSLFSLGGGSSVPMEPYTSYNSPPLALPAASAEAGTALMPCEFGGFMLSPDGALTSWGLLPAPPADLADIVDVAANSYGVIALRAYSAPRIVLQPVSQEIFTGYSGPAFRAQAAGFPAPALQWQKGTELVPGQTQAVLTVAQAGAADAGSYRLTATNAYGSATSDAAVLTVIIPDVFTAWRDQNFTPAAITAGLTAPHADPGSRGIPNLLRYALGLDPAKPDVAELPRLAFGRHPQLPANVGGLFFCVPENVSDVSFRLGVSTNLGAWKVLDVEPVLGPVVNGKRQVWLPCPPDEQDVGKTFYKLIVEPAAPKLTPQF